MKRFNGIVLLILMGIVVALGRAPEANAGLYNDDQEVTYKEYWISHKQFTAGCPTPLVNEKPNGSWYSEPDTLAKCPKSMKLNIPDGISNALKAELYVDLWRNYDTKSARLRINGHPSKIYASPVGYDWSRTPWIQEIPLNELFSSQDNTFLFWGESGKYHIHDVGLRVYYDDAHPIVPGGVNPDTTPPDGELVSIESLDASEDPIPAYDGGVLLANDNKIQLTAKVSGAAYVEFHAYYDGYDDDNDGETREWHSVNRNNWWPGGNDVLSSPGTGGTINHIGTIKTNSGLTDQEVSIIWDVPHVVNQSGIRFKIRVVDPNGNVRDAAGGATPDYTLIRNYPVVYYTMPDFDDYGLHMSGNRPDSVNYTFPLPNDFNPNQYSKAYLLGMYWRVPQFSLNGSGASSVREKWTNNSDIAGWITDPWSIGIKTLNKDSLLPGNNSITYLYGGGAGNFIEHPGPMIVLHGINTNAPDLFAPNVVSRSPVPDSTNIDIFEPVAVRLSDSGVGVDKNSIIMSVDNVGVTPVLSGPSNNLTLTYTPPEPYPTETDIRVTVYACDLLGNCMTSADEYYFKTEAPDLTPPVISNVLVNTTNNSATVTWMTDESATSKVEWGASINYEKPFVSDDELVTKHSLPLAGLQPEMTYNFRLTSTDFFGNTVTTGNLTFKTKRDPGAIISDEFAGCSLNTSIWSYVNPKNDSLLTLTGSGAQISVPAGTDHDLWRQGLQAPRLMQFVTNQDFDVEVKFDNTINKRTQTMGLLVQQDDNNWLRFNFQNDTSDPNPTNTLRVVSTVNNNASVVSTTPITVGAANYMRLNRAGDFWNVQYSTDGDNWLFVTTITRTLTMTEIGPFVGNTGDKPAIVGVIDYFENLADPLTGDDGLLELNITNVGVGTITRVPEKSNYQCNEEVELTAVPAPEWEFGGWSGAINSPNPTATIVMTQSVDVVATFTNDTPYTVNVDVVSQGDGVGGTVTKDPIKDTYLYGEVITLTATPTLGWSFAGWSGDFTGTDAEAGVSVDGDMNITATFVEDEYTIETLFIADGEGEGGTITVDPLQATYKYGDAVKLTLTLNPGWTFIGWEGEGVSGTNLVLDLTMTQNVVAIAHIAQARYAFDLEIINNGDSGNSGNGVILDPEPDPVLGTYGYGQTITLVASADLGWEFGGWGGALIGMEITKTLLITQDNVVSATFNQLQYELVVSAAGPGSVVVEPQKDYYVYGDVVTLTPVPEKGFEFLQWTGDATGEQNPLPLVITQDYAVEAVFQVDTTPIEILDYSVEVFGGTVAVVSWTTDVPGTSRVDYGETAFYEDGSESKDDLVTQHKLTLTGLKPETFYHFQIESRDEDGNSVLSDDLTFSTSSSSGLVSDDFSSCELNDRWTFINPLNDGSYSLGANGQSAEVTVPASDDVIHNVWTTGIDAPRLMQPANDTDLSVEVKFDSAINEGGAWQGLLIEQKDGSFIRYNFYKRTLSDGSQPELVIHAYSYKVGSGDQPKSEGGASKRIPDRTGPMYMRIVRTGDEWQLFYSFDATNWTKTAEFTFDMQVDRVGFFAGNNKLFGKIPGHTAVVDYFFNTAAPIVPEDSFYNITSSVEEGSGNIQFQPDKPGYYCGEEVIVTATGSPGWSFIGWGGDLSGSNPTRSLIVDGDKNITARFQQGAATYRQFLPSVHKP